MTEGENRTTITVRRETLNRFKQAKPYESVSADEFVDELIDEWEGNK